MEQLFKEILSGILSKQDIQITFPNLKIDSVTEMVELESYKALKKIKTIMEDDSLSDFDCVEQIVSVFENVGSDGGSRHDF